MFCPRCQHENEAGAKFCEECAAPLARACAKCGRPLSPTAKFCPECAHPTGPSAAPAPAQRFDSPESYTPKHLAEKILTSKSALEGERKLVTVLFADLKGSMELLADRDPEEARKLLDPVLERMMEAVHRYEGTVNQVMGDGIMALFGAPLAHEDHAVRACYAALDMQAAIRRHAEEVRRSHGVVLQVRVGLNSGEVVVRAIGSDLRMDYTAVGQTTHLAARMEQLAKPDTTLLTADVLRLAEGFIAVTPLGPVPVKGLTEPVELYELTGVGPLRSRLHAAAARGLTRFVGREAELEQVRQALGRGAAGHGQVVALVGEPGVGKSRLVWEVTHSHRVHGWLVLQAGSVSYGKATPYLPVIDLLKGYFRIEDRDDPRRVREKVTGMVLTLDETLKPTLPAVLSLLDVPPEDPTWQALDPPQRRQRTLDAVKRLLFRESQVQPLLVVFEDLHWIDSETQALLDGLVESLPTARVLLLANYRPEYQHAWGGKTYYSQLRLDPLPPESAEELLQALLGTHVSLEPLKQLLIPRTEGNPFFLEESVWTLVETQVLVGERGAYRMTKAPDALQIPATAQAILAARIDRLAPEEKRLLQTASVIGKDVPFALLQAIADGPDDSLRRRLTQLQAAEFLYETSLFPDLEYTFKHALTHEVAYGSVLQDRRRALHARIVDAIEALYPERLTEQVERLAHHAFRGEVWDRALAYLEQAGEKAAARSAYAEAIGHMNSALQLLKTHPETPSRAHQELDLQVALGPLLMATKGFAAQEAEAAYARARELCREAGDSPKVFPVLYGLWRFYVNRAQLRTAHELGGQLLALAQHGSDPALLLEAHRVLGQTTFWLGALLSTRAHMKEAIALYDFLQHRAHTSLYGQDPGVVCRCFAAWALWMAGYPDQAAESLNEALTLSRKVAHPFTQAYVLMCASVLHQFRQEWQPAQQRAEEVIAVSQQYGFPFWSAWGTILRGGALAKQGQGAEGIAEIHHGLAAYEAGGAQVFRPSFLALLAEAYRTVGEPGEGLGVLANALSMVEAHGERWWEAELHRLNGELLLALPSENHHDAELCLHRALDLAREQDAKSLELRAGVSLSRLWHQQGKSTASRELVTEIYGWFTEGFGTADLKDAKSLLDELS